MRKLQIECFDEEGNIFEKIIASKIDATNVLTIISTGVSNKENETIRWPKKIERWNIFAGIVTIYYENGCFIEITKI